MSVAIAMSVGICMGCAALQEFAGVMSLVLLPPAPGCRSCLKLRMLKRLRIHESVQFAARREPRGVWRARCAGNGGGREMGEDMMG